MKKIKEVSLVFENCDAVKIPPENITKLYFCLNNTEYIFSNGDLFDHISCKSFLMEIIKIEDLRTMIYPQEENILERLKNGIDVTHVSINFEDESSMYISVPWGGKNQYLNMFQFFKRVDEKYQIYFKKKINLRNIIISLRWKLLSLTQE